MPENPNNNQEIEDMTKIITPPKRGSVSGAAAQERNTEIISADAVKKNFTDEDSGNSTASTKNQKKTDQKNLIGRGGRKKFTKKQIIFIIIGIIIALAVIGIVVSSYLKNHQPVSVETTELQKGNIEQTISTDGTIVSGVTYQVINNSGVKVHNIYYGVGNGVYDGSLLAQLYDEDTKEWTNVYSNGTGIITGINAIVGQPANGILFIIQDPNDLVVKMHVSEDYINQISAGMTVRFTTEGTGDTQYTATIEKVSMVADSMTDGDSSVRIEASSDSSGSSGGTSSYDASGSSSAAAGSTDSGTSSSTSGSTKQTFTVTANVTSTISGLHIGMTTKNNIVTQTSTDAYYLPPDAITKDENNNYEIFVVNTDSDTKKSTVKAVPVTIGVQSDTSVEVKGDNLSEGMEVVLNSTDLSDGQSVQVQN